MGPSTETALLLEECLHFCGRPVTEEMIAFILKPLLFGKLFKHYYPLCVQFLFYDSIHIMPLSHPLHTPPPPQTNKQTKKKGRKNKPSRSATKITAMRLI